MSDASFDPPVAHASGRLTAESRTILLLFVPLVAVVGAVRILEYVSIRRLADPDVGIEIWNSLPVPALTIALWVLATVLLRTRLAHRHAAVAGFATAGAGLVLWSVAEVVTPTWLNGWLTAGALETLRWDVVVVSVAALVSYAALIHTSGGARRLAGFGVHVLAGSMALFYLLEFAVLRALGVPGLYFPLTDFVANAAGIAPLVAGEAASGGWVLFAAPVLLACAPLLTRRRETRSAQRRNGAVRSSAWAVLPSAAILVAVPLPSDARHVESAAGRFVVSALDGMGSTNEVSFAAPFDADSLRLVSDTSDLAGRRLNVVVLLLESVRATSTTPYSPELATTPFLDSLAREGLLVERMYVPVSYTNKALVSVFAGIPPSPEPVVADAEAFPGGVPAVGLPSLLAREGYRTAFITPAEMEFERKDLILQNLGFAQHYGDGDFPPAGFTRKAYFGYEDQIVLSRTLAWVDSARASGDPFFLGMLTLTSHHPYDLPADFEHRDYGTGDEDLEEYLNSVDYTDRFVRSIYRGFADRGLLESTVFVILGDHGEAFGEHGARTHGDVIWDEVLHVPAVIVGPGIVAGTRATGPRSSTDVVPTVVELLGYRIVGGALPAESLLHPVAADRTLYHAAKNGRVAMALRRGPLKYIYWGPRQPMQVFDIARDPTEREDIAESIDPAERRAVEAELLAWRAGVHGAYRAARAEAGQGGR